MLKIYKRKHLWKQKALQMESITATNCIINNEKSRYSFNSIR